MRIGGPFFVLLISITLPSSEKVSVVEISMLAQLASAGRDVQKLLIIAHAVPLVLPNVSLVREYNSRAIWTQTPNCHRVYSDG